MLQKSFTYVRCAGGDYERHAFGEEPAFQPEIGMFGLSKNADSHSQPQSFYADWLHQMGVA